MCCSRSPRRASLITVITTAALLAASAPTARATVILVVASGEQAELQAAVDAAAGLTEPAVILLGPGAWELVGTVNVGVSHLTILGAGPDRTLLYRDHEDADPGLLGVPT